MGATKSDVNKAAKVSEERLAEFAAHTQSQLDHFGKKLDDVTRDTQKFVKDTVFPIDNRVGDLANRVTWLNNTVVALQVNLDEPRPASASASSLPANFKQMINNHLGKHTVDVRPARRNLNGQRNHSLRQASDKLKADTPTKSVQINW